MADSYAFAADIFVDITLTLIFDDTPLLFSFSLLPLFIRAILAFIKRFSLRRQPLAAIFAVFSPLFSLHYSAFAAMFSFSPLLLSYYLPRHFISIASFSPYFQLRHFRHFIFDYAFLRHFFWWRHFAIADFHAAFAIFAFVDFRLPLIIFIFFHCHYFSIIFHCLFSLLAIFSPLMFLLFAFIFISGHTD